MVKTLLIENVTLVTMNAQREVLTGASLAVTGERIAAIGATSDLRSQFPGAESLDGRGKVVLPGLINAHTHIAMSLQKGITLAVPEGIYRVMWPVERTLTAEDIVVGALIGGAESLLGGTTCVVDHYFHMEGITQAVITLGLRGVLGHTIMSRLGPFTGEQELEEGIDFVRRWKGRHPLITPWLAPHATDTVDREWLLQLRDVASAEGVGLHLHVAQSHRELNTIQQHFGSGCVTYLHDIGFLGPDVLAAHCIYIDDAELELLAASGAHPIYCPMGHALHGKPQRAWELLQRGAGVLIGTDCVTSNNEMALVSELRIAGASQKQLTGDSQALPAAKILEMVTVDAAAAIGMGDQLGALIPGYLADLIMLEMGGLHAAPTYSLLDNIVYACNGRDVDTVMVNGRIVVQNRHLLTANETELAAQAQERGRALIRRAVEKESDLAWLWK
ncbi:MAG: amidohydrolase [Anaerolineae bacterium]|jgi:5-methylthioadenosine/S-adenosylhomocysteine deaminase|nr:amidohydrolase [Anaerolineae bacterium]